MLDPKPENIDGTVAQTHEFKHTINWSYIALSVALIVIGVYLSRALGSVQTEDNDKND